MSVRWPNASVPRPGLPVSTPKEETPREKAKPGEGKDGKAQAKGASTGGASAKPAAGGKGGPQVGQQQDGMAAEGTQRGAGAAGFGGMSEPQRELTGRLPRQALGQQPSAEEAGLLARQQNPVAPELARQEKSEGSEGESAGRQALESRAKLRAALQERLLRGMTDIERRLTQFLQNPGRLGVVNLTLVLSESSVTHEWWKAACAATDDRRYLALALGVAPEADDATLLGALMGEVHQGFEDFVSSKPGLEAHERYVGVLEKYEAAHILPVIAGYDTGPMLEELTRLNVQCPEDFTRSLLVDPLLLVVCNDPEDGRGIQVMVAGLTVPQLGTLVAHMRRLNPLLTNAQVRHMIQRASTDLKNAVRKALGQAEVERLQELAKQMLKLQAVEWLAV